MKHTKTRPLCRGLMATCGTGGFFFPTTHFASFQHTFPPPRHFPYMHTIPRAPLLGPNSGVFCMHFHSKHVLPQVRKSLPGFLLLYIHTHTAYVGFFYFPLFFSPPVVFLHMYMSMCGFSARLFAAVFCRLLNKNPNDDLSRGANVELSNPPRISPTRKMCIGLVMTQR